MRDLLFGMPFWQENINPRSYNKQEIIDTITRNYQKNRSRNEWWEDTSDVHHMYDDEENPEYESPDWDHSLRNLYMGVLQRFFNTISAEPFKFSFSVANYTCYGKSQYIQEHIHPQGGRDMEEAFKLIAEVGFPIAAALAGGYFIFLTMRFILEGVLDDINRMKGIITALDNRVQTMNHDIIRIDTLMSNAFEVEPDVSRLARADGKNDARKD